MIARILPPPSNEAYRGKPIAAHALLVLGAIDLVRGSIHVFAADSGAGRIAGIDLSQGGDVIVMLLAVVGIGQIVWGVLNLLVARRYRSWVPLLLALQTAQQAVAIWVLWIYKPLQVPAPGKFGVLVAFPVMALLLWLSLRAGESGPASAPVRH
jgi:hypothetical protein